MAIPTSTITIAADLSSLSQNASVTVGATTSTQVVGTAILTGPQGPQGPAGLPGATGATGPAGGVTSVNAQTGAVVLTQDSIASGTTNKAYTAAEQTKLAAISGTNTGDETVSTIKTKLGISTLSGANTGDQDLSPYATSSALTTGLAGKANTTHTHTESDVTGLVSDLAGKQATLVSGSNIKTVNGNNLLGSGDITIAGGGTTSDATTTAKGIVQLAGDLSGTAAAPTLANTIGSSGTTGSSGTVIPVITYDAKGRITALSSAAVATPSTISGNISESQVTNLTTDLAAKAPALTPTAVKTAAYTASANEFVPVDTTSGAVTITLPAAPANGTRFGVKMVIQGGTNTITVTSGGTDVFNKTGGNTSVTVTLLNQGVQFQYYNGIWYGVAADIGLTALDTRYAPISVSTTSTSKAFAIAMSCAL